MLFIFAKRQVMRFALRSRRGPHVSVGQVSSSLICIKYIFIHPCLLIQVFSCTYIHPSYQIRLSSIKLNWVLSVQGSMKQLRREIDRRLDYVNYVTHEPQVNQLDF